MMLWKWCTQYASKFGKQPWPQDRKVSVFIPFPKKGNAKECSNYCMILLILHASKLLLKIFQARLQQYVNWELPDVQAGFRKDRRTIDKIANICSIKKKQENFRKISTSASLMIKPLTVWITTNCGKLLKRQVYHATLSASWETCMRSRSLYEVRTRHEKNGLLPN